MPELFSILYVPTPSIELARKIADLLIEKKLAACIHIFPVESHYSWKGQLMNESEHVLLIKTLKSKIVEAKEVIIKNHSYEVPAIIEIESSVNESYLNWMNTVL